MEPTVNQNVIVRRACPVHLTQASVVVGNVIMTGMELIVKVSAIWQTSLY